MVKISWLLGAECGLGAGSVCSPGSVRAEEGAGGLLLGEVGFVQGADTEGLAWAEDGGKWGGPGRTVTGGAATNMDTSI